MTREFVWTTAFLKGWNRCGFSNDDLVRLEDALLKDPKAGKAPVAPGNFALPLKIKEKVDPHESFILTLRLAKKSVV